MSDELKPQDTEIMFENIGQLAGFLSAFNFADKHPDHALDWLKQHAEPFFNTRPAQSVNEEMRKEILEEVPYNPANCSDDEAAKIINRTLDLVFEAIANAQAEKEKG